MSGKVVALRAWKKNIDRAETGKPYKTMTNLMVFVRGLLGSQLRYNLLADRVEWNGEALKNPDYTNFQVMIESEGFTPPKSDIPQAVEAIAYENAYHPIREYLDGLPQWDKKERLSPMFPRLFGSPDTAYEQAIGVRYMIGAVARAYDPGCKMDNMLVLEGPQGIKKSTALRVLFSPEYFTEMVGVLRDNRRFVEQVMGKWCVEFAEFSSLNDSGVDLVKALVSIQIDRTTRNFSRVGATEHPRQCVTAATINPRPGCGYLKDPTGNRRFWPIKCTDIDIEKLTLFRDQIWSEAVHLYKSGERWHLTEQEYGLATSEQEDRMEVDSWGDILSEALDTSKYYKPNALFHMLAIDPLNQKKPEQNRLADVMRALGWDYKKPWENQKDGSRRQVRAWVHPSSCDASQ